MRKFLLVKTSSLGDVVHNLPVVSDIRNALGEVAIDWVVEKSFASIPAMHPGVRRVIDCELRVWRRSPFSASTRRAWHAFMSELRAERYDTIVDTQGLLKSALIARSAHGRRVGLDWHSSREPLWPFYDAVHRIPWSLHAVQRNRQLAALALGYQMYGQSRYGITTDNASAPWLPNAPYAVFLHATSHPHKCWPERSWIELGKQLMPSRHAIVLPWGNASEQERAARLGGSLSAACVAPRLSVAALARVLAGARFVIGVDTGLTHLAAALGVPVIGIYGATDPRSTGVHALERAINLGAVGRFPTADEVAEELRAMHLIA